jgi:hypothetical protein
MKNFESFNPADWQESGMVTSQPSISRQERGGPLRRSAWKMLIVVPLIGLGVTTSSVSVPVTASASVDIVRRETPLGDEMTSSESGVGDEVPSGYWPKMVHFIKSRSALPADDELPDPEPLL